MGLTDDVSGETIVSTACSIVEKKVFEIDLRRLGPAQKRVSEQMDGQ